MSSIPRPDLSARPLQMTCECTVNARPEEVFDAWTKRLDAWFGQGHKLHVYEPGPDGRLDLSVTMPEEEHFGGPTIVWEPEREVTFESNWASPERAWPVPTMFTFRLDPLYSATLVAFFHHGFERLGAAAADSFQGYESAWELRHLKTLREIVEGS